LATLATTDPELAMTLTLQIPDNALTWITQQSVVNALAMKSHREACKMGTPYDCDIQSIIKDWLRVDTAHAEEWLRSRMLDHY